MSDRGCPGTGTGTAPREPAEVQIVAAVQRQLHHLALLHHLAQRDRFLFQHRRLAHHHDRFGNAAGLKRQAQVEDVAHAQHDAALRFAREARRRNGHIVRSGPQQRRRRQSSWLVAIVRARLPVSVPVIVILALGTTPPDWSTTKTSISPVDVCAASGKASSTPISTLMNERCDMAVPPELVRLIRISTVRDVPYFRT